jgi:ESS family glutamate:Na+ symporter
MLLNGWNLESTSQRENKVSSSQIWNYIIDIAMLSILLLISTAMKRQLSFFRKNPIPIPVIAGFLGLILGKDVLGIISFNSLRLENLLYHLMNIGFIALSLKASSRVRSKEYMHSGMFIVSNYVVQGLLGFSLSLLFFYTIFPGTFPLSGLLLPLGFGQGPGQAYAMGKQWEELGFTYGGNMGLTIAAMGYIWACAGGVALIAWLRKKKGLKISNETNGAPVGKHDLYDDDKPEELPMKESVDGLTLQLIIIGAVYLLTYLTLKGLESLLVGAGGFGRNLAQLLWGFSFIIGAIYGMSVRRILDFCHHKKWMKYSYTSNYLLERVSGGAFDFMITAAISAVSIYMLKDYLVPFLIITSAGGLLTIWFIMKFSQRIYKTDTLENALAMYGMLTGTISTGIALLREVDPNFRTQAAKNLVFGSGTGLAFGLPLMIILNIPIMGYVNKQPILYLVTLLAFVVYLAVLLFAMLRSTRERKSRPGRQGSTG